MEDKTVFWEKRMEIEEDPRHHYTAYTPVWTCPVCKTDYDPDYCKIMKYCCICGARIKDGDAAEKT